MIWIQHKFQESRYVISLLHEQTKLIKKKIYVMFPYEWFYMVKEVLVQYLSI